MRTFLLVLAAAVFLYTPFAPSWGRAVVNTGIVLALFGFFAKAVPRRRYR